MKVIREKLNRIDQQIDLFRSLVQKNVNQKTVFNTIKNIANAKNLGTVNHFIDGTKIGAIRPMRGTKPYNMKNTKNIRNLMKDRRNQREIRRVQNTFRNQLPQDFAPLFLGTQQPTQMSQGFAPPFLGTQQSTQMSQGFAPPPGEQQPTQTSQGFAPSPGEKLGRQAFNRNMNAAKGFPQQSRRAAAQQSLGTSAPVSPQQQWRRAATQAPGPSGQVPTQQLRTNAPVQRQKIWKRAAAQALRTNAPAAPQTPAQKSDFNARSGFLQRAARRSAEAPP
jgi:hypothetical protein